MDITLTLFTQVPETTQDATQAEAIGKATENEEEVVEVLIIPLLMEQVQAVA